MKINRRSRKSLPLVQVLVPVLLLALLSVGCASTRTVGEQVNDAEISSAITTKFAADPEINPFNLDVDTIDGRVRLSGTVDDERTMEEAIELARDTKGVVAVDNDIEVGSKSMRASAGDAGMAASVKGKLAADPQVNPFNIDVDVQNGVVTLSGVVATRTAKDEAAELAESVKGVKEVKNLLKVKDS